jgi:hypothetical protein
LGKMKPKGEAQNIIDWRQYLASDRKIAENLPGADKVIARRPPVFAEADDRAGAVVHVKKLEETT